MILLCPVKLSDSGKVEVHTVREVCVKRKGRQGIAVANHQLERTTFSEMGKGSPVMTEMGEGCGKKCQLAGLGEPGIVCFLGTQETCRHKKKPYTGVATVAADDAQVQLSTWAPCVCEDQGVRLYSIQSHDKQRLGLHTMIANVHHYPRPWKYVREQFLVKKNKWLSKSWPVHSLIAYLLNKYKTTQ